MLTVKKLPIDIELLIDKAGYSIHPISGMYKDYGVKGAVLKRTGGYDIAIDENTYETQEFFFRTTLAEELSHIILHEEYVAGIKNLDDVIKFHKSFDDEDYKRIEQQARCLGSQLLLPSELFDDEVLKWVQENEKSLRANTFFSKEALSDFIAEQSYKQYSLSKDVVRYSIRRFPDPVIDKILSKFGLSLIQ